MPDRQQRRELGAARGKVEQQLVVDAVDHAVLEEGESEKVVCEAFGNVDVPMVVEFRMGRPVGNAVRRTFLGNDKP